jgi:hypothetical protein
MDFASDVNANIFFINADDLGGTVGLAWLGSLCDEDPKFRSSVNQWLMSDLNTAEVGTFMCLGWELSHWELLVMLGTVRNSNKFDFY